jgi:hypothetical protein
MPLLRTPSSGEEDCRLATLYVCEKGSARQGVLQYPCLGQRGTVDWIHLFVTKPAQRDREAGGSGLRLSQVAMPAMRFPSPPENLLGRNAAVESKFN